MREAFSSSSEKQKFQQTFAEILQDSKIDPQEARKLLAKFDLERQEIISVTQDQLQNLKNQFWEDFDVKKLLEVVEKQASYFLDTRKPNKDHLYDWITSFMNHDWSKKYCIDIKNPIRPAEMIQETWDKIQNLISLVKNTIVEKAYISLWTDGNPILELDTSGSNLYIKQNGQELIISWQNNGNFFVENVSEKDFLLFVKNYDRVENKRVLEEMWFVWWISLWGLLAFSFRNGLWLLLWNIGFLFTAYRANNIFKSYNLSQNEVVNVLKTYKDNQDIMKNYLYLSQIWYITTYKNWLFQTIDGEKLTGESLQNKQEISPERYQLLRGLQERWYAPKFIAEGKYELDMHGIGDKSPLIFEWWSIKFSTNYFENGKQFEFQSVSDAFIKIQKINECIDLQLRINQESNSETYDFNNKKNQFETKLNQIKTEFWLK